jgi:hypothetical protein
METFPKKKRGRPRKLPEPPNHERRQQFEAYPKEVREITGAMVGFTIPTERTEANRYYADRARAAVRSLSQDLAERPLDDPVRTAKLRIGMDWVMERSTVLTELGRMLGDDLSEAERWRFQDALTYVALKRPSITAKEAAAYVKNVRLGRAGRKKRLRALYRELDAVVSSHMTRYPETTVDDVIRCLNLVRERL